MGEVKWNEHVPVYTNALSSGIAQPQPDQVVTLTDTQHVSITGFAHGDGAKGTQAVGV